MSKGEGVSWKVVGYVVALVVATFLIASYMSDYVRYSPDGELGSDDGSEDEACDNEVDADEDGVTCDKDCNDGDKDKGERLDGDEDGADICTDCNDANSAHGAPVDGDDEDDVATCEEAKPARRCPRTLATQSGLHYVSWDLPLGCNACTNADGVVLASRADEEIDGEQECPGTLFSCAVVHFVCDADNNPTALSSCKEFDECNAP
ncbi:hypothetical protein EXS73_03785 [Candidatus Pacearchaeota archaeon]|nr:hypothetical protein [Candidatus Pacearchaeota archaeon]